VSNRRVARALFAPPVRTRFPSRGLRGWLAALSFQLCLAAPALSAADDDAANAEPANGEAVLVGSSSFNQSFGHLLARELEDRGYQVTRKGVSGAGLARPDFRDMSQVLEELPIGQSTAAVFVYLGVNDAQAVWLHPHERGPSGVSSVPFGAADWDAIYSRRTREFLERICQRGAQRVVVLLPVDVNRAGMQRRLERIREIQVQAASQTGCASAVETAGDAGQFEVAGVAKRLPDGYHMSSLGAQVVWQRIEAEVLRLLSSDAPRQ
jgi:hypothetical protein